MAQNEELFEKVTSLRYSFCMVPSIRENQGKKFSSGKLGNFVESQEKSGNLAVTEVNQVSTLIQMHFFLKPDFCQDFFSLLRSAF